MGVQQMNMSALYEQCVTQKAKVIAMDPGHALAVQYQLLPSGWRFRMPLVATTRTRRSFVPKSIDIVNRQQLLQRVPKSIDIVNRQQLPL